MKLCDKIVNQIKGDITGGKYKPGEKIPAEPVLMKMYNVGRSTIREAIKTLAISEILIVQQGSGTFVNTRFPGVSMEQRLRRADFDEVNIVRALLEKETVRLAILNHTDEHLTWVEQNLEKRKLAIQSEIPQKCADADIEFHMAIANASGNKALADLYYSFTLIIRDFFSARETRGISHFAMNHYLHEQLFKAIKAKKISHAELALQKILDNNY